MPPIRGISVVIPAYNAAGTIVESIASVIAAAGELDETAVEIVVADDGSTDGTADLVTSEFGADPRVRLRRHRRNRGGAAARNTAVEGATNSWIFCLDSDNLVDPKSLRRIVAMAATGEWDVVAPAETRYFFDDPQRPTHSWFWDRETVEVGDPLRMYETPVASGNYLFTLDVWARAGGYPEFAASLDAWGFGVRVLFEGARFGVCPDTFYLHRQGHESYYMRDNDDRRSVAAAQILLPYVERLAPDDRRRLLDDGDLLRYFVELPERPLEVEGTDARPSAARVVVAGRAAPGADAPPTRLGRMRAAAHRAWAESPPRSTLRQLTRRRSRRGPGT